MKTTLLWSLVALCGVVGGGVALHGGWSRVGSSLGTIRFTKVVWVTNEVSRGPWSEPLKPLEAADDGYYTTLDGRRLPMKWSWTNVVVGPTTLSTNFYATNMWVKSPDSVTATNYTTNPVIWTWATNIYLNIGAYRSGWSVTNRVDR